MTIPAGVVEALNAALVDGADSNTALKLALTGYTLVPSAAALPVGWTDEQELRDVDVMGFGYLFTCKPVTPHADERRVKMLYLRPQDNPALVSFPRCTFKQTSPTRYNVLRGDEVMGEIYCIGKSWFIELPHHRIGDVPAFHSFEQAMGKVIDVLDRPA